MAVTLTAGLGCLLIAACSPSPQRPPDEITVWKPLGAWSGTALQQTDAFISDTGELRISWEARPMTTATPGGPSPPPSLRIAVHSAVSGRLLEEVLDHHGPGKSVVYFNEDPRSFFLVIEPASVEWTVDVAEGVAGTRRR